jgi:hypothetical protein
MHVGLDLVRIERGVSSAGMPVTACAEGVVERVVEDQPGPGPFSGYGNAIVVRHGDWWTFYAHLSRVMVREGEEVHTGQTLGLAGNTSNGKFRGMAAHLHFEVRRAKRDGSSPFPGAYGAYNVDPEDWLRERGVLFDRRGRVLLTRRACPQDFTLATSGLGKLAGPAPGAPGGAPAPAMVYEPPAVEDPDLWLLNALPGPLVGAVAAAGLLVASWGFWLALRRP